MCDTMVALGNSTVDGQVYFAKNSDRQPNEPHILIQIPRRYYLGFGNGRPILGSGKG